VHPLRHVLVSLALGSVTTLAACAHAGGPPKAPPGPPPPLVTTVAATRGSLETTFTMDGQVTPFLQSTIATQQAGNIVEVDANEGDRVRKGALLARIDDAPLQAQLQQKLGATAQDRATLQGSRLQHPVTAQTQYSALADAQATLAQGRSGVVSANASVQNAKATYDADVKLVAQGYLAQTAFESARQQYVAAQQSLQQAQQTVAQGQAALAAARRNLQQIPIQTQAIAANEGALATAEGEARQLRVQIDQTYIRAPYDGVITQRLLDPGAYASATAGIFQISRVGTVYVNFNVPDQYFETIRPGTRVVFRSTSGATKRYSGRVLAINPVPTAGTLSYRARLAVENADLRLRGGQLVTVTAVGASVHDATIVPLRAVQQNANGANVYVAEPLPAGTATGGAPRPRMKVRLAIVHVVLQSGTRVAVRGGGVVPGTIVTAERPETLHDGGTVQIASGPHR